jgi:carbon monoxide dehydrogenase subunit G
MTTVTVTSLVAAPVEHVFDVFTDLDHIGERVTGITQVEPLTAGDFNLHTRWRETRQVGGREVVEEWKVTAFEKDEGYTISDDTHRARAETRFAFQPENGGTRVTIEFTLDTRALTARLMAPLGWAMSGRIREAIAEELEELKTAAEAPS